MSWNERPDGIWDIRAEGLRDPRAVFPPGNCLVVNAQNERLPWVFFVDFPNSRVGQYKYNVNEFGLETLEVKINEDGTRRLTEIWGIVPGVKVIPIPQEYRDEVAEKARKTKLKYRVDQNGEVQKIVNPDDQP